MSVRTKMSVVSLLAIATIGAGGAPTASAVEFHYGGLSTSISGIQVFKNEINVPGAGTISCTSASLSGSSFVLSSPSLTLHPEYAGCKAFGFSSTDVTTPGCNYELNELSGLGPFTGSFHILCGGGAIRVTPTVFGASVCTMTFGTQSTSGGFDVQNWGSGLLLTWTMAAISHSAGCGSEAGSNATMTGQMEVFGSSEIWVE